MGFDPLNFSGGNQLVATVEGASRSYWSPWSSVVRGMRVRGYCVDTATFKSTDVKDGWIDGRHLVAAVPCLPEGIILLNPSNSPIVGVLGLPENIGVKIYNMSVRQPQESKEQTFDEKIASKLTKPQSRDYKGSADSIGQSDLYTRTDSWENLCKDIGRADTESTKLLRSTLPVNGVLVITPGYKQPKSRTTSELSFLLGSDGICHGLPSPGTAKFQLLRQASCVLIDVRTEFSMIFAEACRTAGKDVYLIGDAKDYSETVTLEQLPTVVGKLLASGTQKPGPLARNPVASTIETASVTDMEQFVSRAMRELRSSPNYSSDRDNHYYCVVAEVILYPCNASVHYAGDGGWQKFKLVLHDGAPTNKFAVDWRTSTRSNIVISGGPNGEFQWLAEPSTARITVECVIRSSYPMGQLFLYAETSAGLKIELQPRTAEI